MTTTRVAGARRRATGSPAITSRSHTRPSAHQRRGMARDVVLDLGWGRLVFGHTFGEHTESPEVFWCQTGCRES